MEIFANIFAGLGLFFIGIKGIGSNLKQMAGRRFRALMARATRRPSAAALLGTLAGALTQSTNAVTFIVVSMVTAGLIDARKSLPIVSWANVGTSLLVLLATLDIRLAVLYLLGTVGVAYYMGLNEHERYRHLVGALLGVGLLFLGLWLIKSGAAPLKELAWVQTFLRFAADSFFLAFAIGAVLTLVAQSSATVTVVAVTMVSVGLLTFDQTVMIVLGASVGSGLSVYLLSGNLSGTGRQLALIQVWTKVLGVLPVLPAFLAEIYAQVPGPKALIAASGGDITIQVAWLYLLLQLVSVAVVGVLGSPMYRLAQRLAPSDPTESLGRPKYLYEQALEDPESALDLVIKEQARLVRRLPRYLDALRPEEVSTAGPGSDQLHKASTAVSGECSGFLSELMGRAESRETMERAVGVRSRNDLLMHLQEGVLELTKILASPFPESPAQDLRGQLTEGLHAVLQTFADDLGSDEQDHELLLAMSTDRSALMERVRFDLLQTDTRLCADTQTRLLAATGLFERVIWLVHRYALLLERHAKWQSDETLGEAEPA